MFFDRKAQLRGKAPSSEHPQRILPKPPFGVSYASDDSAFEVGFAIKAVGNTSVQVHGHRVNGKITAGEIFGQIWHKYHAVRVSSVVIRAVSAESRDLKAFSVQQNGDGPVFDSRRDAARKERHDFLGQGRGRNVPVVDRPSEKRVAHAPAHKAGRKARVFERF